MPLEPEFEDYYDDIPPEYDPRPFIPPDFFEREPYDIDPEKEYED